MRTVNVSGLPVGDGHPPRIMSVLNLSENSGFEPSVHVDGKAAAEVVDQELVPAGADIIDVGLQSANPEYETRSAEHELEVLEEAREVLEHTDSDTVFSLETRYAEVAEAGIEAGFDLINDVCGFADPEMRGVCEAYDVPVVKMASPPDLDRPGALETIDDVFDALRRGGFTDKTIIDPAFGGWYDGKTYEDNWEMFRRLREFRAFGRPILTATNREDFLGHLAGRSKTENQLAVSLAAATMEVERGAHIVRTHDTAATRDVVQVAHALGDPRTVRNDAVNVSELTGANLREVKRHVEPDSRVVGELSHGSLLSFVITGLSSSDTGVLEDVAESSDLTAVISNDQAYLTGDVAAFEAFLERLPTDAASLEEIVRAIHESVSREQS